MSRARLLTWALIAILLGTAVRSPGPASAAGENLLNNPGFEQGLWDINHPEAGLSDTNVVHGGERSARLQSVPGDSVFLMSNLAPVDRSSPYELEVWIRTQDVTPDAVSVKVLEVDSENRAIGWHGPAQDNRLIKTGGTHDWQQYGLRLEGFSLRTAYLKVYLWVDAGASGFVWFDDTDLSRISSPGDNYRLSVSSPKVGNVFAAGETVSGTARVDSTAPEDEDLTLELRVVDKAGNAVLDDRRTVHVPAGGEALSPFSFDPGRKGVYYGTFKLLDASDRLLREVDTRFGVIEPLDAKDTSIYSPFGAQTHFGQYKADPDRNLPLMSEGGMKWTRDEMYWSEIERQPGRFDFPKQYDAYADANARYGLSPVIILDYGNALYDRNANGDARSPHTAEGLRAFARYVTAMVKRYGDRVKYWEVWNEPNGSQFWGAEPDAREYAAVLKTAYTSIKRADPEAKVIGGAIAGTDLNYLRALFDAGGLEYMDALSIHPYRVGGPEETQLLRELRFHQELMKEYGYEKPIWLTEIGWSTDTGPYGVTEQEQAQYLTRMYIQALSTGYVREVNWYDFQDDGPDSTNHEHRFGIVTLDLSPKPAYTAYAAMVDNLQTTHYVGQLDVGDGVYVYVFARNGEPTIAVWSLSSRQVSMDVGSVSVRVADVDGNARNVATNAGTLTLTVGPDPQYIQGAGASLMAEAARGSFASSLRSAREALQKADIAEPDGVEAHLRRAERELASASEGTTEDRIKRLRHAVEALQQAQNDWISQAAASDEASWKLALFEAHVLQRGAGSVADVAETLIGRAEVDNARESAQKEVRKLERVTDGLGADERRPHAEAFESQAEEYMGRAEERLNAGDTRSAYGYYVLAETAARAGLTTAEYEAPAYTGVYLSVPDYSVEGVASELQPLPVAVHNTLDQAVTFELSSKLPDGWRMEGDTSAALSPDEWRTFEVRLLPPDGVAPGTYTLTLGGVYDGGRQVGPITVDVRIYPALALSIAPLSEVPRAGTSLHVRIRNASTSPQAGEVSLQLPEGWTVQEGSQPYGELAPGEETSVAFTLTGAKPADYNEYDVGVVATYRGGTVRAAQALDFLASREGTISVDGDLSDWKGALPLHLNRASQVAEKRSWSPDDLSAVAYTSWDSEYFYVAVRVTDDTFRQAYTDGDVWRGDGVQLAFDALNDKSGSYDADDSEWGLTLTSRGPQVWRWKGSNNLPSNTLVSDAKLSVVRDGTVTTYEAAIPLSELEPLDATVGNEYGLDVLVNDDDGSGRSGWIQWTPGIGYGKVPAQFDTFTFVR